MEEKRKMEAKIGKDEVRQAGRLLREYKAGKAALESRIVDNEQWYRLRHGDKVGEKALGEAEAVSAWLFNSIANKHADAMDNFPEAVILPREEGDTAEAQMLSSIIPVVLEQCEFEQTYSDVWDYKLKAGTGIYGIFWDKSKLNGLGDITIRKIDIINLFISIAIIIYLQSIGIFNQII